MSRLIYKASNKPIYNEEVTKTILFCSRLDQMTDLRHALALLAGWLAGWLVGWLAGWLVGWLAGWLVGWLAGWLVGWLAGWLVGKIPWDIFK